MIHLKEERNESKKEENLYDKTSSWIRLASPPAVKSKKSKKKPLRYKTHNKSLHRPTIKGSPIDLIDKLLGLCPPVLPNLCSACLGATAYNALHLRLCNLVRYSCSSNTFGLPQSLGEHRQHA